MADLPQRALDDEVRRFPVPALRSEADGPSVGALEGEDRSGRLARLVEREIVPRLVLARRAEAARHAAPGPAGLAPTEQEVEALAELVIERDLPVIEAFVEGIRARGVAVESLYLELLAPAARRLGVFWEEDRRTFSEVTIGLWRLHQLLHGLSVLFRADALPPSPEHRILLVPAPGEQHAFGLTMAAEFFRRAGWLVSGGPALSAEEITTLVHREWFAIVGISASSLGKLDTVATTIHTIRRVSRNRALGVLVGGVVFDERPERAALVGADAWAGDARRAPLQARALLDLLVQRA
jgi:methanogenic corrinoid protein MtbC1